MLQAITREYRVNVGRFGRLVRAAIRFRSNPVSAIEQTCPHFTVRNGICVTCNKTIDDSSFLPFDCLFGNDVARHSKTLLRNRKLVLVLDLDHTLLHSCKFENLTSEEKYLKQKVDSLENISDGSLFRLKDSCLLVKLRPYVRNFLEKANNMFEMYVCTKGSRRYAEKAAKLLDPDSKYFNSRIIASEDLENKDRKDLNLVLGQKSNIVILDDTECVWRDHAENLITVSRYEYFKKRGDVRPYSGEKKDESESNGALANILRILKTVHALFFDNPASGDVPSYLAKIRGGILMGCTLLFTDLQDFSIWSRDAELIGATCTTVLGSSITHVISSSTETAFCRWAKQKKKFLVHPRWIEAAYFLWHRQPEEDYFP